MNKFALILLLCTAMQAQSNTWSHVFSETPELELTDDKPLLVNNRLVFKGKRNETVGLWSYDLEQDRLSNLIPPDVDFELNDVVQFGDAVYFLLKRFNAQPQFQLWKSDGNIFGTEKVSDVEFVPGYFRSSLAVYGNTLFSRGDNGAILELNGSELVSHNIQSYSTRLESNICAFGPQNFLIFDSYEYSKVLHINSGQVTELTAHFPEEFFVQRTVMVDGNCYLHYTIFGDRNNATHITRVSQNGDVMAFSDISHLQHVFKVIAHQGFKYAVRNNNDEAGSSTIVRLTAADELTEYEYTLPGNNIAPHIATQSLLAVYSYNRSTSKKNQYLFDLELNPQHIEEGPWGMPLPIYQNSENTDVLINYDERRPGSIEMHTFNQAGAQVELKSVGFDFVSAVSSTDSDTLYQVLRNRENGIRSIYALSQTPKVGTLMNGMWIDPALKNQGLVVRQGIRADGSRYVFASFYTYRNGQPLWLAGASNFTPNQDRIDMDLYEYNGTNFLQIVEVPNEVSFGELTLQQTACDQLNATITHAQDVYDFNFHRVDNTTFKNLCLTESTP